MFDGDFPITTVYLITWLRKRMVASHDIGIELGFSKNYPLRVMKAIRFIRSIRCVRHLHRAWFRARDGWLSFWMEP